MSKREKEIQRVLSKYSRLMAAWDNKCVICGGRFHNPLSLTKEHLIPRTVMLNVLGQIDTSRENIAPSHYACNQFKGSLSLVTAMVLVDILRERMGHEEFVAWANAPVPNRFKCHGTSKKK